MRLKAVGHSAVNDYIAMYTMLTINDLNQNVSYSPAHNLEMQL